MRIFDLIHHFNIIELDVQELIDGFEGAADGDVILELDRDLMVDEGFEEAIGVISGSDCRSCKICETIDP